MFYNIRQLFCKPILLKHTSAWCSPVNLLHIFKPTFSTNTSGRLLLKRICMKINDQSMLLLLFGKIKYLIITFAMYNIWHRDTSRYMEVTTACMDTFQGGMFFYTCILSVIFQDVDALSCVIHNWLANSSQLITQP